MQRASDLPPGTCHPRPAARDLPPETCRKRQAPGSGKTGCGGVRIRGGFIGGAAGIERRDEADGYRTGAHKERPSDLH